MTRRPITFICAYYDNPNMLVEQQRVWSEYPARVKQHFHAIVTDDCSPRWPALPHVRETGIASFQLYRTGVDIRWNWLFGRNLGVAKAPTDWVLLTDIDHVVPLETLVMLQEKKLDPMKVYRFSRVDAPKMTPYKPHPNTWCMTRKMFESVGGYDERLSGCYGTDGEFRDRVQANARAVVMLEEAMVRYAREVIPDASTHPSVFTRKNDPANDADLLRRREKRAQDPLWRPLRVTFPYEHQVTIRRGDEAVSA